MQRITSGLTDDPEHDRAYLIEQIERYKDHELGREIVRACGRLLWEVLPEDARQELNRVIESHGVGREGLYQEVYFNLQSGDPQRAHELMEPHIREFDESTRGGFDSSDTVSCKCDFKDIREYTMYLLSFDPDREIRPTVEDYTNAYLLYGASLFELGRHEEAISALEKALEWDPVSTDAMFEIGENLKVLGDMAGFIAQSDKAYPFIFKAKDLARYHRNKGFHGIWCTTMDEDAKALLDRLIGEIDR